MVSEHHQLSMAIANDNTTTANILYTQVKILTNHSF